MIISYINQLKVEIFRNENAERIGCVGEKVFITLENNYQDKKIYEILDIAESYILNSKSEILQVFYIVKLKLIQL